MSRTIKPIVIEISSDSEDDKIVYKRRVSSSASRNVEPQSLGDTKGRRTSSIYTPRRQSIFPSSSASSIRSCSSHPSIFDNDCSPVGTPLTPPLPDAVQSLDVSRKSSIGDKSPSRRLFNGEQSEERNASAAYSFPAIKHAKGIPRPRTAPKIHFQRAENYDAEHDFSDEMSDLAPCLSDIEMDDSPMVQRTYRKQHGIATAATVETVSMLLGSMSLEREDTISRRRSRPMAHVLQHLDSEVIPDKNGKSIVRDGRRVSAQVPLPCTTSRKNQISKAVALSRALGIPDAKGVCHHRSSSSPIVPPSKLTPRKISKKPNETLSPSTPSGRLRSKSEPQQQFHKSSPSPSGTSSFADSDEDDIRILEQSTRAGSASATSSISDDMDLVADSDVEMSEDGDISKTLDDNARISRRGSTPVVQKKEKKKAKAKAKAPLFESYNSTPKTTNELKLGILRVLRRGKWEDKLSQYLATKVLLACSHSFRKRLYRGHPLIPHSFAQGYIYIFKSDAYPGYVKIGRTKQQPGQRISQWEKQCNFICIQIPDPHDKLFSHYEIVEELVQAELWNERRKFKCNVCGKQHRLDQENTGGTKHGEWFEVTEKHALEVVQKWRSWIIEQAPYRQHGVLSLSWRWKYQQAMDRAEIDWVKWRSIRWFERPPCVWSCMHTIVKEDAPIAFLSMVAWELMYLFLPIAGYFKLYSTVGSMIVLGLSGYFRLYC